jgi:predicted dehydrogenase
MTTMIQSSYRAAVIGRTGRGDYGHGLDVALLDQPRVTVVAVADENPAGRAAAAKRLGVEQAYDDYRTMLDREKPQLVVIGPRWVDAHKEMILACAERGIHMFCEKPMARDIAECDAIVTACERAHVKLAMAFQTRYGPRYERAKELIASGAIGEVLEVRGRGKEDRRGGGEDLLVLGPHVMDVYRDLLGEPAWCYGRVTENGRPITRASVRDGAEGLGPLAGDRIEAMYGFARNPAIAYFATARPKDGANRRYCMHIFGAKGVIELGFGWLPGNFLLADPAWTDTGGKERWTPITSAGLGKPEPLKDAGMVAANRLIVADLIRAIESDTQPRASVYDGRGALEMLLACHASNALGKPAPLPLAERVRHPLDMLS